MSFWLYAMPTPRAILIVRGKEREGRRERERKLEKCRRNRNSV